MMAFTWATLTVVVPTTPFAIRATRYPVSGSVTANIGKLAQAVLDELLQYVTPIDESTETLEPIPCRADWLTRPRIEQPDFLQRVAHASKVARRTGKQQVPQA